MHLTYAAAFFGTLAAAVPQVADPPVEFWAQIYHESDSCSGSGKTSSYLGSRGNCVNMAAPGNGSAIVRVGGAAEYYLAGWTEPDCTGKVVFVETNVNSCISFGGSGIASFSNDEKPFGS